MRLSASASMWRHVLWWPMWSPWVFKEGMQNPKIAFPFHAISLTFWVTLRAEQWTAAAHAYECTTEPARSGFTRQCCFVAVNWASLHRVVSQVHYRHSGIVHASELDKVTASIAHHHPQVQVTNTSDLESRSAHSVQSPYYFTMKSYTKLHFLHGK